MTSDKIELYHIFLTEQVFTPIEVPIVIKPAIPKKCTPFPEDAEIDSVSGTYARCPHHKYFPFS